MSNRPLTATQVAMNRPKEDRLKVLEIKAIINLYFSPPSEQRSFLWKDLVGDVAPSAEAALNVIRSIIGG